jgi:hypothetical protein
MNIIYKEGRIAPQSWTGTPAEKKQQIKKHGEIANPSKGAGNI